MSLVLQNTTTPQMVLVVVICFNNGKFVENFVRQLQNLGVPPDDIWIINNASTCPLTKSTLEKLTETCKIFNMEKNEGHLVALKEPFYSTLPEIFALSDPDLELNVHMPPDWYEVLLSLTEEYGASKAGLALSINEEGKYGKMYKGQYLKGWEAQFWKEPIQSKTHPDLLVYKASIDTTFAVYNKKYYRPTIVFPPTPETHYDAVRVAGNYTCYHLPWYPKYMHENFTKEELVQMFGLATCSTTAQVILSDPFYK